MRILTEGGSAVGEVGGDPGRFGCAQICGLQKSPNDTLGRYRVFSDKLGSAEQHAAEVIRPRAISRTVDQ